jgi:hypothetical protein
LLLILVLGRKLAGKGVAPLPSSLIWMMMKGFDEDFLRIRV